MAKLGIHLTRGPDETRGFDPGDVAEPAMPDCLVELALEADRLLTY